MHPTYAVIDVETTGLKPAEGARVVEIAIVRSDISGTLIDEWSTLIKPTLEDGAFTEDAYGCEEIHGITSAMLEGAPSFSEVIEEISTRIMGCTLVAHNAPFDLGFLIAEWQRTQLRSRPLRVICTLRAARVLRLAGPYGLTALAERFGITNTDPHRALADTHVTAALWSQLLTLGANPEALTRTYYPTRRSNEASRQHIVTTERWAG